jgi:hypothetical protein
MTSGKRTIAQFWENPCPATLVVVAVTWSLLLPFISLVMAAEPLSVGGLPVT